MRYPVGLLLGFLLASCQSAEVAAPTPSASTPVVPAVPTWSGSMRSLQQILSGLEPYIFDEAQFADAKNRVFLGTEIKKMAQASKNVRHNPTLISRDPTVRYVSGQFMEDLQRADESFASGRTDFARYRLLKVTGYCVECHTRTNQGPELSFGRTESFLKKMKDADQVEYLIAIRKFDDALKIVMASLRTTKQNAPPTWDLDKMARRGLQVAVQFKQDLVTAQSIVTAIAKNPDTPFFLQVKAKAWQRSLDQWGVQKRNSSDLAGARALVKNRLSEIEDMRAIAALLRVLSQDLKLEELGEALLLTGESYELLNDVSPLSLHENYYESCIRQVPHSKWSKLCFERLKSSIVYGYSGSSGTHIPLDVEVQLERLKKEAE